MRLIIEISDSIKQICDLQYDVGISAENLDTLIKAVQNGVNVEQSEDCISSQATVDEWKKDFKGYVNALNIPRDDYNGIMAYIDELPSVISQTKRGRWIWDIDEIPSTPVSPYELNYEGWVCSCCHQFPDDICDWDDLDEPPTYKFCPNCGSYNGGDDDGNE